MLTDKEKHNRSKGITGKFFWKQKWFSICSMHYPYKEDCGCCNAGAWTNVWQWKLSSIISSVWPKLWVWYMNRPNSKARRQIMQLFPKLRDDNY